MKRISRKDKYQGNDCKVISFFDRNIHFFRTGSTNVYKNVYSFPV